LGQYRQQKVAPIDWHARKSSHLKTFVSEDCEGVLGKIGARVIERYLYTPDNCTIQQT